MTTFPKLAVMADPKDTGRHPYHDNRWIVTEGTEIEWDFDFRDWRVAGDGALIAMMRDCQNQKQLARLFSAAPELLEALEALLEQADLGEVDEETQLIVDKARHAIAKARGL